MGCVAFESDRLLWHGGNKCMLKYKIGINLLYVQDKCTYLTFTVVPLSATRVETPSNHTDTDMDLTCSLSSFARFQVSFCHEYIGTPYAFALGEGRSVPVSIVGTELQSAPGNRDVGTGHVAISGSAPASRTMQPALGGHGRKAGNDDKGTRPIAASLGIVLESGDAAVVTLSLAVVRARMSRSIAAQRGTASRHSAEDGIDSAVPFAPPRVAATAFLSGTTREGEDGRLWVVEDCVVATQVSKIDGRRVGGILSMRWAIAPKPKLKPPGRPLPLPYAPPALRAVSTAQQPKRSAAPPDAARGVLFTELWEKKQSSPSKSRFPKL